LGGYIRNGEFDAAAKLLQPEVDQYPLDRGRRLILGKLRFGNRDFAAAAREFQTIEQRGGTKDDYKVVDLEELTGLGFANADTFVQGSRFKDSAAWLYLSGLRQGQDAELAPGPRESIRSLLRGETSVADYVRIQKHMMVVLLDQFGRDYGSVAGVSDMVATGKKNLEAELTCVARFALAEQALGRQNAARDDLSAAVATDADRIIEFHIAKAELQG
jgi:hypothetical protein